MFTGIVQDLGQIESVTSTESDRTLVVRSSLASEMEVGSSISVNGTCLTAVALTPESVELNVVTETLQWTALDDVRSGDRVNLELPMTPSKMFDGHIVQGHVDGVGIVRSREPEGDSVRMSVEASEQVMRYLVEKGSVTVDGVSLTVASIAPTQFGIAVIPHTLSVTTLGVRTPGDRVNIEVDVLAKYVERLISQ